VVNLLVVFTCASQWGATGVWTRRIFGASLVPARAAIGAVIIAALLYVALDTWSPQGWWVLPYGGVLYAIGVGILRTAGGMKQRAAV
jgi:hypothetical protein